MRKRKIIAILGIVLLLLALSGCGAGEFNYTEENLSKYISISEEDYKGYTLEVLYDEMRDSDLDRKIMSLRYAKRKEPLYDGGNVLNLNLQIDAGDTVKIYYRGYTIDESGNQNGINGACNFSSSTPHSLGIGSLGFIPGFEESLIGVKPNSYARLGIKKTGEISDGDVVYLTYNAMLPDGKSISSTAERIDLSSDVDSKYGVGFKDFLLSAKIGQKVTQSKTFAMGVGTAVYFDMSVVYATSGESEPLTISTYFPSDYQEESLRGKTVLFDVYFEEVIAYDTPEYDEAFITELLGISEADLSEYEGEGIVEKHKNMLKAEIISEYDESKNAAVEKMIWEHLHDKVNVKKLPKKQVEKVYNEYYVEIQSAYNNYYSSFYSTVDEFATAYLKITDGTSWKSYIQAQAENIVTEKLIFYYIIREEGFVPSFDEYEAQYNKILEEYINYYTENIYKDELNAIKDAAEKEKRIAQIKAEMIEYYGEDYFSEIVYYEFSFKDFISLPNVVKK